jgi:hypothetical protein
MRPGSGSAGRPGDLDHRAREAVQPRWGAVHLTKPARQADPDGCTPIAQPRRRIGTPRLRWSEAARQDELNDTQIAPPGRRGPWSGGNVVAGRGGRGMDGGHPDGDFQSRLVGVYGAFPAMMFNVKS